MIAGRRGAIQLLRRVLEKKRVRLVVNRESDEHDDVMFDNMREQTLLPLSHVPAIEAVRAAGMEPMKCGDSFTITVTSKRGEPEDVAIPVRRIPGSANTRIFSYGGYVHLWSMSSAAKEDAAGVNEFTKVLIDVINEFKPVEIYAANISRLVRSQQQAALLLRALLNKVEIVWAGTVPFHFKGPAAQTGMLFFSVIAMMAALERDWIVQRLLCGQIASWRAGKWPFGDSTVPFGYTFNETTSKLEINPDQVHIVREMLFILGQPDVPDSERLRQLGAIGVTSARRMAKDEERRNIALMQSARATLDSIYASAPVWICGEYLLRQRNGFQGLKTINGLPVMRAGDDEVADRLEALGVLNELESILGATGSESDMFGVDESTLNVIEETFHAMEEDYGEIQMLHKLPVPEGGWASAEVLAAFAAQAVARHERLSSMRTSMRPLSKDVLTESSDAGLHAALFNGTHVRGADDVATERRKAAHAHQQVPPLSGTSWTSDGYVYEIGATGRTHFSVNAYPISDEPSTVWGKRVTAHDGTVASRGLEHKQVVARFNYNKTIVSMIEAVAQAAREGIPVEVRRDPAMATQTAVSISPDALDAAIDYAKQACDAAGKAVEQAAIEVLHTEDEDLRAVYRRQAEDAVKNKHAAERKLANLKAQVAVPDNPLSAFTTNIELMVEGLQRLLTCDNSVTQVEYLAIRNLLRRLRIDRHDDGQWWGTLSIQFTDRGGVLELGPITFPLDTGGAAASAAFALTKGLNPHHPRWIENELLATKSLNDAAVRSLVMHNFRQAPYVVLAALGAHPFPEWVDEEWRDPVFVQWMKDTYTDPDFTWDPRRPLKISVERQFLVHLVSRYGTATVNEFAAHAVPGRADPFDRAANLVRTATQNLRAWQPAIRRVSKAGSHTPVYEAFRCECGRPLSAAVRLPEVLTDMLCSCRRMGGLMEQARPIPDDLRFPTAYIAAAPDWDACLAEMARKSEGMRRNLKPALRKMLLCDALNDGGHIKREIAQSAECNAASVTQYLRGLEALGYVETGLWRTANSPEWHLTEAGRLKVDELRAGQEAASPAPAQRRAEVVTLN